MDETNVVTASNLFLLPLMQHVLLCSQPSSTWPGKATDNSQKSLQGHGQPCPKPHSSFHISLQLSTNATWHISMWYMPTLMEQTNLFLAVLICFLTDISKTGSKSGLKTGYKKQLLSWCNCFKLKHNIFRGKRNNYSQGSSWFSLPLWFRLYLKSLWLNSKKVTNK